MWKTYIHTSSSSVIFLCNFVCVCVCALSFAKFTFVLYYGVLPYLFTQNIKYAYKNAHTVAINFISFSRSNHQICNTPQHNKHNVSLVQTTKFVIHHNKQIIPLNQFVSCNCTSPRRVYTSKGKRVEEAVGKTTD